MLQGNSQILSVFGTISFPWFLIDTLIHMSQKASMNGFDSTFSIYQELVYPNRLALSLMCPDRDVKLMFLSPTMHTLRCFSFLWTSIESLFPWPSSYRTSQDWWHDIVLQCTVRVGLQSLFSVHHENHCSPRTAL